MDANLGHGCRRCADGRPHRRYGRGGRSGTDQPPGAPAGPANRPGRSVRRFDQAGNGPAGRRTDSDSRHGTAIPAQRRRAECPGVSASSARAQSGEPAHLPADARPPAALTDARRGALVSRHEVTMPTAGTLTADRLRPTEECTLAIARRISNKRRFRGCQEPIREMKSTWEDARM